MAPGTRPAGFGRRQPSVTTDAAASLLLHLMAADTAQGRGRLVVRPFEGHTTALLSAGHGVTRATGLDGLMVTAGTENRPRLVGRVIKGHQSRRTVGTMDPHLVGLASDKTRKSLQLLHRLPVVGVVATDAGGRPGFLGAGNPVEVAGYALDVGCVFQR